MESLYQETNSLLQQFHYGLASFERINEIEQADLAEQALQQQIQQIWSKCSRLDILVTKESASHRRSAHYRTEQLKQDCRHLELALNTVVHKFKSRWKTVEERRELLNRTFVANDTATVEINDGELQLNDRLVQCVMKCLINCNVNQRVNSYLNIRLMSADSHVDELLDHGRSVMDSLRSQQILLKGAKRKILDMAQKLGVSITVLRMIERRVGEDNIIFIVGACVTLLIMFLIYKFYIG